MIFKLFKSILPDYALPNGLSIFHELLQNKKFDVFNVITKWADLTLVKISLAHQEFPGATLLHYCCLYGHEQIVSTLLEEQSNINEKDFKKNTPLHYSALNGQLNLCKYLISKGCSLTCYNSDYMLPFHMPIKNDKLDTFIYLVDVYKYIAKEHGVVSTLNTKCKNGLTPLMLSCMYNASAIFKFVLSQDINVNAKDFSGKTAIFYAIESKNAEFVTQIIDKGVDFKLVDNHNEDAAFYAVKTQSISLLKLMISKGLPLFHKNNDNKTLAHVAAQLGLPEILGYLIENGVDESCIDKEGKQYKDYCNTMTQIEPLPIKKKGFRRKKHKQSKEAS